VKKIAIEHGGMITADSSSLGGARLRLTLPVQGTAAARELSLTAEHPNLPVA
jgi:signal transduction histidine kinase